MSTERKSLNERTPIEQYAYAIVKELQAKCVAEHRAPVCVTLHEINKRATEDIKNALNGFIADKTMVWYKNVNGIPMFRIENELD